jgi:hypothetical protein
MKQSLKTITCFFILVIFFPVFSGYSKAMISGKILDSETGEPLPYTNIFLSNTTIGTTSDRNGFFTLRNIPPGYFDLVVRYIGYELKVIPVKIIDQTALNLVIDLKPELIEVEEISVEAPDPKWWRNRLKEFTIEFFGPTEYAKKCELMNPEVLDFKILPSTIRTNYIAQTDSVLVVENRATGYRIFIHFGFFKWGNFDTFTYHYQLQTKFEELEFESENEHAQWVKNRRAIYDGSLKHFFSVIATEKKDHGFTAYLGTYQNLKAGIHYVITSFDRQSLNRISPENLRLTSDTKSGLLRFFLKECLMVIYKEKTSYLYLNDYALIDSRGSNYSSCLVRVLGYWADLRMAGLLPMDYLPQK